MLAQRINNVVRLNQPVTVESAINRMFMEMEDDRRGKTVDNYRSHYKRFFMYILGKEAFSSITWDDILSITFAQIVNFKEHLFREEGLKRNSVNAHLSAVKSLYKYLYNFNHDIRIETAINVAPLREFKQDKENNSYGSLTEEEILALYDFCLTQEYKPMAQMLFFKTAIVTGNRKDSLLQLQWKNIRKAKDNYGADYWVIFAFDKGKEVTKPISDEYYQELSQLKRENSKIEDKVFGISDKCVAKTLRRFCEIQKIPEERNIVIHSLKKASCDMVWNATKDAKLTAKQGNHSNFSTTYENYLDKNKNYAESPSYFLFSKDLDTSALENCSKEQLIEAIKTLPSYTIREVIVKLNK